MMNWRAKTLGVLSIGFLIASVVTWSVTSTIADDPLIVNIGVFFAIGSLAIASLVLITTICENRLDSFGLTSCRIIFMFGAALFATIALLFQVAACPRIGFGPATALTMVGMFLSILAAMFSCEQPDGSCALYAPSRREIDDSEDA